MANIFIKKQLDFIINNTGKTDIYEIDKIRYGLEVFYGEISKLLVMMLIALILDKLPSFFIMITLLTLIRPHVGGSHAKSFISCMIQSNLLFLIVYFLASIIPSINIFLQFFIIVFSIIIIRKFKPINPLRKTVHTQYKNLKFKNIVTLTLITWFIVSNLILNNYYINCGILIILYIIFDFLREVYKNEKKING
ncbi:accessory gene regulator B family protein [Clostridium celatum]|uniref:accessory gene regulator B family protein n=1 Tax=Clostridium celatum TaxID=36834 RepID=UPI00290F77EE|nr:accessory gene regulator B family protein [Clostridium celatum]MDU6294704.1 accessory gene regulator B family protein [Clostridium celatum]